MCYNKTSVVAKTGIRVNNRCYFTWWKDSLLIHPSRYHKIRFRPWSLLFQRRSLARLKTRLIARGEPSGLGNSFREKILSWTCSIWIRWRLASTSNYRSRKRPIDMSLLQTTTSCPGTCQTLFPPPPPHLFAFFAVELKFSGCQKHAIKRWTLCKCRKVSKDLFIIHERFARLLSLRTDVRTKNVAEEERLRF